ncbi:hypothetical protein [Roseobacter sp. HKCCA0434]|uniref:hypothetical protein n=1 Tax=Roseobacter sp. HKCCA0434 TaxID=3079297 RepID=UPI002905AA92|nr:hypothetical protein [Roseobacter sp. HKCCA0434]
MSGYAPRHIAPGPVLDIAGVAFRTYAIGLDAAPVGTILPALDPLGADLANAIAVEGGAEGHGFTILHEGEAGTWQLALWWAHGDILCQRLWRADPGTLDFVAVDDRPLMACVWELHVIAHEQRAWIAHMDGADYAAAAPIEGSL